MRYRGDVDREFFENCEYVVWSPASFFISGDWFVLYGAPAIVLPIRSWVALGATRTEAEGFTFEMKFINRTAPMMGVDPLTDGDYRVISGGTDRETTVLEGFRVTEEAKELLAGLESWKTATGFTGGISFKILCDTPLRCGMNSSAAITACLSFVCFAFERGLTPVELEAKLQAVFDRDVDEIVNDDTFRCIFSLACYFDNCTTDHIKSCLGTLASLIRSTEGEELIFFFTERRGGDTGNPLRKSDLDPGRGFTYGAAMDYFGRYPIGAARIPLPDWAERELAFSLVYSRQSKTARRQFEKIGRYYSWDLRHAKGVVESCLKCMVSPVDSLVDPLQKTLSGTGSEGVDDYAMQLYGNCMSMVTLRILDALSGDDANAHRSFQSYVGEAYALLNAADLVGKPLHELKEDLRITDSKLWCKQIGAGNGGDLAVFGSVTEIYKLNGLLTGEDRVSKYTLHYTSTKEFSPVTVRDKYVIFLPEEFAGIDLDDIEVKKISFCGENGRLVLKLNAETRAGLEERKLLQFLAIASAKFADEKTVTRDDIGGEKKYKKLRQDLPQGLKKLVKIVKGGEGQIELDLNREDIEIDDHITEFRTSHERDLEKAFLAYETSKLAYTLTELNRNIAYWLVQWHSSEEILHFALERLHLDGGDCRINRSELFKKAVEHVRKNSKSVDGHLSRNPALHYLQPELDKLIPGWREAEPS